jgi:hypothetical protein
MLTPKKQQLITYKKIAIYQQSYQLPIFKHRRLKFFQNLIKQRRKLIQEGIRYQYYFGKFLKNKEKVSQQEIFSETQLLVNDYIFLINGLESYQDSYYQFLLKLSHNLKLLFSEKYQQLKILDYERIKLAIKNSDNQKILSQLELEKQGNLEAILLLGKTSFLMLEKTKILGEGIKKLAEDTEKQKKIVERIIQELKIYEELNNYQIKSQQVRQEIAELAQNAINFETYLKDCFAPFQSLIEEVIKVDEEFYAAVGEIKYLVDNIFQLKPEALNLENSEINSEFLLDFMATGYQKEDRLKEIFFDLPGTDFFPNDPPEKTINQQPLSPPQLFQVSIPTFQLDLNPKVTAQNYQKKPNLPTSEHLDPDYRQLREFLRNNQWQQADTQTTKLLLKIIGKAYWDEVYAEDIINFPCQELKKIDQLWLHYSNGHFGFSIQQTVWLNLGGNMDYQVKKKLGDRLGWRKEGQWLNYEQISQQLSLNQELDHPIGLLPVHWLIFESNRCDPSALLTPDPNSVASWRVGNWLIWQLHLVLAKVQTCKLIPFSDF